MLKGLQEIFIYKYADKMSIVGENVVD